ncbi:30S ribosomal protein S11 [Candidatus Pacearchaeota archaeon CG10_big_fil_rev_8_21_14_0_10_34_76]|nr:MAG: 30S ribosomal protein S11 [Candidatus Pacearchaeota archaeon CG10_big_fil_rev_8_21_14_0_10_34_76]
MTKKEELTGDTTEGIEKIQDVEENPEQPVREKKSSSKAEREGIAYIFSSYNNTILHITDLAGNTIARVSGGMVTKHDRLKANPTTAMFVAKNAAGRAKDIGITSLYVRLKAKTRSPGIGPGAHAIVKTLGKEGFKIVSVVDVTRSPRGGPKKKGGKRGRRV